MPVVRIDDDDEVYRTADEKYEAIIDADRGLPRARPADPGRHHLDREVGDARRDAAQGEGSASGPQRPLPRAGSLHHRPGRRARRGHHRHQHGRPRHRHPARRQCRHAHPPGAGRHAGRARARRQRIDEIRAEVDDAQGRRRSPPAASSSRHRAPREPAHRQPAARPLRPPGRPRPFASSSCRCRTT